MNLLELSSNLSGKKCLVCEHAKEEHPVFVVKGVQAYGMEYDCGYMNLKVSGNTPTFSFAICEEFRESVQLQLFDSSRLAA